VTRPPRTRTSVPVIDGSRGPFIIIGTSGKWPPSTPGPRRRSGGGVRRPPALPPAGIAPRTATPMRIRRRPTVAEAAARPRRRGEDGCAWNPPPPLVLLQVEGRTEGRAGRLLRSRGGESLSGGLRGHTEEGGAPPPRGCGRGM
jgi:hypothetical protein